MAAASAFSLSSASAMAEPMSVPLTLCISEHDIASCYSDDFSGCERHRRQSPTLSQDAAKDECQNVHAPSRFILILALDIHKSPCLQPVQTDDDILSVAVRLHDL